MITITETKYKVGDKIKIKSKLDGHYPSGLCINMRDYENKIVTIADLYIDKTKTKPYTVYRISEDGGKWAWNDEMIEGLATETVKEVKLEGLMDFRIKDYKVINNKVVVVEFSDGDIQKAVCMPGDEFSEEQGLEVCLMKHICGGKAKYHKVLKEAQKQIAKLDETAKKKAEEENRLAQKQEKDNAKKAARKERAKQARIAEMKAAYLSALQEYNGDTEKAIEVVEN